MSSRQLPTQVPTITPFRPELSDSEADNLVVQMVASRMGSFYRKNLAKYNKQYLEAIALNKPITRQQCYAGYIKDKLPCVKDEKVVARLSKTLEQIYLSWPSDQKSFEFDDQLLIDTRWISGLLATGPTKMNFFESSETSLLFALFCKLTGFNLVIVCGEQGRKDPHTSQQL
jgi:hypothetical protein